MPTYEYACRDCGEHLEVVQSFKDDALTECPNCEGELRKVFSAAGIIFKGSGWHIKDYGSSKGASTSAPSETSSDNSPSDSSPSDSSSSKDTSSSSSKGSSPKDSSSKGSSSTASAPTEKSA